MAKRARGSKLTFEPELIGGRLRQRRKEARLSLRKLEELTGVGIATLSEIEKGQPEMRAAAFFAICKALTYDPVLAWYGPDDLQHVRKATSPTPPPVSVERASKAPRK